MTAMTETDLIAQHLDLVRNLVSHSATNGDRAALTSAANLALLLGVRKFDPARGLTLRTYLAVCIRHALADEWRHSDWLGRDTRAAVTALQATADALTAAAGRQPSTGELAAAAGCSSARVRALRVAAAGRPVALTDDLLRSASTAPTPDPADVLIIRERVGILHELIEALPTRMRLVVHGCDLQHRSIIDVGVQLGVSSSRVSQIRCQAKAWMRDGSHAAEQPDADNATSRQRGGVAYLARCAQPHTLASRLVWTDRCGDLLPQGGMTGALVA